MQGFMILATCSLGACLKSMTRTITICRFHDPRHHTCRYRKIILLDINSDKNDGV